MSRVIPRDWCAGLLHDGDHLDPVALFMIRPPGRPRPDLGPDHILIVDQCAVVDVGGHPVVASVVVGATEEIHADAVTLVRHRLPLFASRGIAARPADGDNAAGTSSSPGRGEDSWEDSREACFEGR